MCSGKRHAKQNLGCAQLHKAYLKQPTLSQSRGPKSKVARKKSCKLGGKLDRDLALRIALATREFEGLSVSDFLALILSITGEPLTPAKLKRLRAKKLKDLGGDLFEATSTEAFARGFALLKGRGLKDLSSKESTHIKAKPEMKADFAEDEPSLIIACASNTGQLIDGAFYNCRRFLIYRCSLLNISLCDVRTCFSPGSSTNRLLDRALVIADCDLLYTTSMGAFAMAKAVKLDVHVLKVEQGVDAEAQLRKLQQHLCEAQLAPWLINKLNKKPKMRPL
ncbi:dinitrogenase iron-molybdenum cofactor N-terminal domain-containing protein [Agaribacterium sp. ZY112]|uniref:dinitrogenase iron-molybdenum cofactor N-terminal domain-containing protein n=1 Tax=Agaribacterium sp. ZY112 TaxID=3233574 RepID=UPI003525AB1A